MQAKDQTDTKAIICEFYQNGCLQVNF